jgi:hypothetical protein
MVRLKAILVFVGALCAIGAAPPPQLSDGNRVAVESAGFTIKPPAGWEVHKDHPHLSLFMQVPYKQGLKFQRAIQVGALKNPIYIDESTAKEFEEELMQKFGRADAAIQNYRIRNYEFTQLADGRPAILFYAEYLYDDIRLMQAHLLISSNTRHYLLTYTDLAENFEERAEEYWNVAWTSMVSMEIKGEAPIRFIELYVMLGAVGALVLIALFIRQFSKWKSRRHIDQVARGIAHEEEHSMVSEFDEHNDVEISYQKTQPPKQRGGGFWRKKSADSDDDVGGDGSDDRPEPSAVSIMPEGGDAAPSSKFTFNFSNIKDLASQSRPARVLKKSKPESEFTSEIDQAESDFGDDDDKKDTAS